MSKPSNLNAWPEDDKQFILTKLSVTLDGYPEYGLDPLVKGHSSFTLGITDVIFEGRTLAIFTRRPGLLIGKKGETLNALKDVLVTHTFFPKNCEVVVFESTPFSTKKNRGG